MARLGFLSGRNSPMTPEQKAAFINSQVACALIEAAAMTAENQQREAVGHSMAYNEEAFLGLIDSYGISHNKVVEFFNL
jgi:hypothetical protein